MNIQTASNIVRRFSMLDAESIREYCTLPDVTMDQPDLLATKRFFDQIQHRTPSVGELIFLDAFIGSIKDSPDYYAPARIRANDAFIAKPLFDLIKARNAIHPDEACPFSVSQAFATVHESAEYQQTRSFSTSDVRIFISDTDENAKINTILKGYSPEFCENGICVAKNNYSVPHKRDINKNTEYVALVIYPKADSDPQAMQDLAKIIAKSKKVLHASASAGKHVFTDIYSLSQRLILRAEKLQLPVRENILESFADISEAIFTDSYFSSTAIIAVCKKKHAKRIQGIAQCMGLESCAAIEIPKTTKFRIYLNSHLLSEIRGELFDTARYREIFEVEIPSEQFFDAKIPEVVNLCKIEESNDLIYSVVSPLSDHSYQDVARSILSAFISAAYDGYNLKNSCFSLAFKASVNLSDKEHITQTFSSLSAVYSSVTELGLSIDCANTQLTDGAPAISVFLRVSPFGEKALLSTSLSKDSVAKLVFRGHTHPDFSVIKDLMEG